MTGRRVKTAPFPTEVNLFRELGLRRKHPSCRREHQGGRIRSWPLGLSLVAAEIGMIAGIGRPRVEVIRQPKVVILSSGDELVDIYDELTPGKIRDTNGYTRWLA